MAHQISRIPGSLVIRRSSNMGNSQGVLIPKPILAQLGLAGTVDLQVRDGVIEIRPSRANPREGWAEDARRIAASDPDPLVWPAFANQDDADLAW